MNKPSLLLATALMLSLIVSGCVPRPYTIAIPQGNLIDEDRLAEVKIGMEPRQVRYLLGTPLVTDTFNQHRWDYFYSIKSSGEVTVEHHVTIHFTDDRVSKIEDRPKA